MAIRLTRPLRADDDRIIVRRSGVHALGRGTECAVVADVGGAGGGGARATSERSWPLRATGRAPEGSGNRNREQCSRGGGGGGTCPGGGSDEPRDEKKLRGRLYRTAYAIGHHFVGPGQVTYTPRTRYDRLLFDIYICRRSLDVSHGLVVYYYYYYSYDLVPGAEIVDLITLSIRTLRTRSNELGAIPLIG